MPKSNAFLKELPSLQEGEESEIYLVNGKKVQLIKTTVEGEEKISDIRIALTEAEYRTLREKVSERHISKYQSITHLDIQNEFAYFNTKVDDIERWKNPTEADKKYYPVTRRLRQLQWYFWDVKQLEDTQAFMKESKKQLLDPLIEWEALRNNPWSLIGDKETNINTKNINQIVLERLKEKLKNLKTHLENVNLSDEKLGKNAGKWLGSARKKVLDRCEKFEKNIQDCLTNNPTEEDVVALFKNHQLGRFVDLCYFDLIDGIDKNIREDNGNDYWDLWNLHPARKACSRVKRKLEARAFSLAGAQLVAERPVPEETINSLINDVSRDESAAEHSDSDKRFWVSIKPYIDKKFSMTKINKVFKALGLASMENATENTDTKNFYSVRWKIKIFLATFLWEPIPIVLRTGVSFALVPFAMLSILAEKSLSLFPFETTKKMAKNLQRFRKIFIDGIHKKFGSWCKKGLFEGGLSLSVRWKKQRNEAYKTIGGELPDTSEMAEYKSQVEFLDEINRPMNRINLLIDKHLVPSKWANNIIGISTSLMSVSARFVKDLSRYWSSSQSSTHVFSSIEAKVNKRSEQIVAALEKQFSEQGILSTDSDMSSETIDAEITEMALSPKSRQATRVDSFARSGHELLRVFIDDFVNAGLCESPLITTGGVALSGAAVTLSLLSISILNFSKLFDILGNVQTHLILHMLDEVSSPTTKVKSIAQIMEVLLKKQGIVHSGIHTTGEEQRVTVEKKNHSTDFLSSLKSAYNNLMKALIICTFLNKSDFQKNGEDKGAESLNLNPYDCYNELYTLFETYNAEADKSNRPDLKLNGKAVLQDFYSAYCYEKSNNVFRPLVLLGNVLLITPLYRRAKKAILRNYPDAQEQFGRSQAKDMYLFGEFIATAGRLGQVTLRVTSQVIVATVGVSAIPVALPFMFTKKGRTRVKNGYNWLSDTVKLHYLFLPRLTAYAKTASMAATTHDLSRSIKDLRKKAFFVSEAFSEQKLNLSDVEILKGLSKTEIYTANQTDSLTSATKLNATHGHSPVIDVTVALLEDDRTNRNGGATNKENLVTSNNNVYTLNWSH